MFGFAPGSATMWLVMLVQAAVPLLMIAVVVAVVVGWSRRQSDAAHRGQARTTPLAQRLAELDAMYGAGTITAAERDAARARLLGSL